MNQELSDVQAGFRKGRGTTHQIANSYWFMEKAREFPKTSTSASLTTLKPFTLWITTNCGKFLEMGILDHLTCLLRNLHVSQRSNRKKLHGSYKEVHGKSYMEVTKKYMEQLTGSTLGKE